MFLSRIVATFKRTYRRTRENMPRVRAQLQELFSHMSLTAANFKLICERDDLKAKVERLKCKVQKHKRMTKRCELVVARLERAVQALDKVV